jgi:hypothetical protein
LRRLTAPRSRRRSRRRRPRPHPRTSTRPRTCGSSHAADRCRHARAFWRSQAPGSMLAGVTTVGPPRVVAVEGATRGWRGGHSLASNPAPYTTWPDTTHGPTHQQMFRSPSLHGINRLSSDGIHGEKQRLRQRIEAVQLLCSGSIFGTSCVRSGSVCRRMCRRFVGLAARPGRAS